MPAAGEPEIVPAKDAVFLLKANVGTFETGAILHSERETAAKKCAQQVLRDSVAARGGQSRGTSDTSKLSCSNSAMNLRLPKEAELAAEVGRTRELLERIAEQRRMARGK